jgi:hypothetical protein
VLASFVWGFLAAATLIVPGRAPRLPRSLMSAPRVDRCAVEECACGEPRGPVSPNTRCRVVPPSPTGRRAAGVPRRAGILPSCRGGGSLLAASAPPSSSFGMAASPDRSAGVALSGSCLSQGRSTRPCCCSSAESSGSSTATASPTPGSGPRCRRPPLLTCAECGRQSDEKATGGEADLGADDIDELPEDEEPRRLLAFVFCPECANREFGDAST